MQKKFKFPAFWLFTSAISPKSFILSNALRHISFSLTYKAGVRAPWFAPPLEPVLLFERGNILTDCEQMAGRGVHCQARCAQQTGRRSRPNRQHARYRIAREESCQTLSRGKSAFFTIRAKGKPEVRNCILAAS